jgi:proteasome assembly chaperone (PAC2) family protein
MPPLRIIETPELREPVLITAFAGWADAGSAATTAVNYLIDRLHAVRLAEIDPDEFYDFTQLRPMVRYEGDVRRIDWPQNAFFYHQTADRDLMFFSGIEPHLRWKKYTAAFMEAIERFGASLVVSLGALNVDLPHTRPLRVTGTAPTPEMAERAGLASRGGRYEGPTGIGGVLSAMFRERDLPLASVWANVPYYVTASPNPTAALAILRSLTAMLEFEVPMRRMQRLSDAFDRQLNEAAMQDEKVREYVQTLEERYDQEVEEVRPRPGGSELPSSDVIVKDIEEFLRRRGST